VKTNVDYQIVGCFATQDETTQTITEALTLLSNENKTGNQTSFLLIIAPKKSKHLKRHSQVRVNGLISRNYELKLKINR